MLLEFQQQDTQCIRRFGPTEDPFIVFQKTQDSSNPLEAYRIYNRTAYPLSIHCATTPPSLNDPRLQLF